MQGQNNMINKVEKKRQKEQYVVDEMIRLYCRKHHAKDEIQADGLCPACQELADYAKLRSQKCPFMEKKTFCANCKVHCYKINSYDYVGYRSASGRFTLCRAVL